MPGIRKMDAPPPFDGRIVEFDPGSHPGLGAGAPAVDYPPDDAVRDVHGQGYVQASAASAVLPHDVVLHQHGHLPRGYHDLRLDIPQTGSAGRTALRHMGALGVPGGSAPQAPVRPQGDVPLMGSAGRTALGLAVMGVPCVAASYAGDLQVRIVPFDRTAAWATLGWLSPAGHPLIGAPVTHQPGFWGELWMHNKYSTL